MRRHRFDGLSFVFGALFVVIGGLVVTGQSERLLTAWLLPAITIGLGVLLLVAAWQGSHPAPASAEPAKD